MSIGKDLDEIAAELMNLEYGELRIIMRGGEIVSYTIIRSKLKSNNNMKPTIIKQEFDNVHRGEIKT